MHNTLHEASTSVLILGCIVFITACGSFLTTFPSVLSHSFSTSNLEIELNIFGQGNILQKDARTVSSVDQCNERSITKAFYKVKPKESFMYSACSGYNSVLFLLNIIDKCRHKMTHLSHSR